MLLLQLFSNETAFCEVSTRLGVATDETPIFPLDLLDSIDILLPSGCSRSPHLMDKLLSAGGMIIKGVLPPSIESPLSESPLVCRRRLAAADG